MNPKPVALPVPTTLMSEERAPEPLTNMLSRRSDLLLELGNLEATIARVGTETVCGSRDDSQDVELYDGTLGDAGVRGWA